jgi:hypothetical protein
MSYEATLKQLSETSKDILLRAWSAVERGDLSRAVFPNIAAEIVAIANERGRAAAEIALNGYLIAAAGEVTAPVVVAAVIDDRDRLEKAFMTILATDQDIIMQLERIGVVEPLEAAARRMSEGIQRDQRVKGWVREMEADACQLCRWWWREGREWPAEHPMPTHKGCVCTQLPVTRKKIASTMYTRKLERAQLAEQGEIA